MPLAAFPKNKDDHKTGFFILYPIKKPVFPKRASDGRYTHGSYAITHKTEYGYRPPSPELECSHPGVDFIS
jgi:hypothetical protein